MGTVLIRYGELFLKSESVMRHYVQILLGNIRRALDTRGLEYTIEVHRGRILIDGPDPDTIAAVVSRIFGVVGASVCVRTPADREVIEETAVAMAVPHLTPGMSFAVRARRSGMKGFTSQELGASIGSRIYTRIPDLEVDLKHPGYEIHVEARDWGGLIYDSRSEGPGGLPFGTQGRVLSLISAGIDSPVATWLVMRRGCRAGLIHFDGGCYGGKDIWKTVTGHLGVLSTWTPGIPLSMTVINLEPFYEAMIAAGVVKNRCLICKRFMLRVAERLAADEEAFALVMGDNIGQVASQTLVNMGVIEDALSTRIPILRPLITYDKQESVDIARAIGTFRESAGDLGCSVVPKHPAIAASLQSVHEDEGKMDIGGLIERVMQSARVYRALNGELEGVSSP
jgi:thiamine biosynthesis protein ThiI